MKKAINHSLFALVLTLTSCATITPSTAEAVFRGENGKIIYGVNVNGNIQYVTQNPDGSQYVNITPNNTTIMGSPIWSPDGNYLYYVKDSLTDNPAIYMANADGSSEIRISDYDTYGDLALSADGGYIFLANHYCLDVLDIRSGESTCIIEGSINGVAASPDGTLIAYGKQDGLYTLDLDTGTETQIANAEYATVHDWSADGSRIAYTESLSGGRPLNFIDGNGNNQTIFDGEPSRATDDYYDTVFSPDSTSIAYNKEGAVYITSGFSYDSPTTLIGATDGAASRMDWQALESGISATVPLLPFTNSVHRFYNPSTQHHFYTASNSEAAQIRATMSNTWFYEGTSFGVKKLSNCSIDEAVYRFWSNTKQSHFYTISVNERDYITANYPSNVWRYEGVAYCADSTPATDAPVYRFWSNTQQSHFYTTSATERDDIIRTYSSNVWNYEGTAFWVVD